MSKQQKTHKHKPHKSHDVKPDKENYSAFKLTEYQNLSSRTPRTEIDDELRSISALMLRNQQQANDNGEYDGLIKSLVDSNTTIKHHGRKNALGRVLSIEPSMSPTYQPYNFAEMYRENMTKTIGAHIQKVRIRDAITKCPDATDYQIRNIIIDKYGSTAAPRCAYVKNVRRAMANGNLYTSPRPNGILPLSATDGHYRHIERTGRTIDMWMKMECAKEHHENGGMAHLRFVMPANKRYHRKGSKVSMPDVHVDENGSISFFFVSHAPNPNTRDASDEPGWLGVDLGVIEPFMASVICEDGSYSQPVGIDGYIRKLVDKSERLYDEEMCLSRKAKLVRASGKPEKADILDVELSRVRDKRCHVRGDIYRRCASRIVSLATSASVGISFEDLSWAPSSHWDESRLQGAVCCLASRAGTPVRRVDAAHTSTTCAFCSGDVRVVSNRRVVCDADGRILDRDVSASRVIGLRACVRKCLDAGSRKYVRYHFRDCNRFGVFPGVLLRSRRAWCLADDKVSSVSCSQPQVDSCGYSVFSPLDDVLIDLEE